MQATPTLVIKNNLPLPVDLTLLNPNEPLPLYVNAREQFLYDMRCEGFTGSDRVSILTKLIGEADYTVLDVANPNASLANTVAALNTLGIGQFMSYTRNGIPYITIFSVTRQFADMTLYNANGNNANITFTNISQGVLLGYADCVLQETFPAITTWNPVITDEGSFITGSNAYGLFSDPSVNIPPPFVLDDSVENFIEFVDLGNGGAHLWGSLTVPYPAINPAWDILNDPLEWPYAVVNWIRDVMFEVTGMAPLPENSNDSLYTGVNYGVNPQSFPGTRQSEFLGIGNAFNGQPNLNFGSVNQFGVRIRFRRRTATINKDFGTLIKVAVSGPAAGSSLLVITAPGGQEIERHVIGALQSYEKFFTVTHINVASIGYIVTLS